VSVLDAGFLFCVICGRNGADNLYVEDIEMPYVRGRGKFIVIEGGEGSGKGSCIEYLRESLPADGVVFTYEPGGTTLANEIREVVLKMDPKKVPIETQLMLVNAARVDHVDKKIRPTLLGGKHVICDRFDLSTYVYQLCAPGLDNIKYREVAEKLINWAVGDPSLFPVLCIYLDVEPEVGLARVRGRVTEGGEETNFDRQGLVFHEKVRDGYLRYLPKLYPGKSHCIVDANRPLDVVQEDVLKIVMERLNI